MSNLDYDIQEAEGWYQTFKTTWGETWKPFSTPAVEAANLQTMFEWGSKNFPRGLSDFRSIGSYELAFRACLGAGTLKQDPAWITPEERRAAFEKEYNLLPASVVKQRYLNDPDFKRNVDSMPKAVIQNVNPGSF